jgi:hypothetical protein
MLIPAGVKVHLALGYTDLRKASTGLASWSSGCWKIKILGRYRDQAGTTRRATLATAGKAPGRGAELGSTESALSWVLLVARVPPVRSVGTTASGPPAAAYDTRNLGSESMMLPASPTRTARPLRPMPAGRALIKTRVRDADSAFPVAAARLAGRASGIRTLSPSREGVA